MFDLYRGVPRWTSTLALLFTMAVAVTVVAVQPVSSGSAGATRAVVVSARPGGVVAARAAVERLGGTVTGHLPIINGLSADVASKAVGRLRNEPAIAAMRPDERLEVQSRAQDGNAGQPSAYRDAMGASALAAAGLSGQGVTVALVDSGVSEVPDLAGRLVEVTDPITGERSPCVNLSGEPDCNDSYGHGTFMAGIIAGNGASSGGKWAGVAPGANIVSIKVAGRGGSSSLSKVLAGIQWAVSHRERYGIRVLNLALGTEPVQAWDVDPLNVAVERAWDAGIVVAVAAGNRGPSARTVSKPGDDPLVITVGAVDDRGTASIHDDGIPDLTSRGPTVDGIAKPDVVASGVRLVSLRAPGSTIDTEYPWFIDGSYRPGSGTSMATAAVTGGAALLLERNPSWTADQVKDALRATARPVAGADRWTAGAGMVDLAAAAVSSPGPGGQTDRRSSGMGTPDASRGDAGIDRSTIYDSAHGPLLGGNGRIWDPLGFVPGGWRPETRPLTSWANHHRPTTPWHGDNWHGDNWHGDNWHGEWQGSSASGARQADSYGKPWKRAAWHGLWD